MDIQSGAGVDIDSVDKCTCIMPGNCNGYDDLDFEIEVDEPGVVLLCRQRSDDPDDWRSCGDNLFGASSMIFNPDLVNTTVKGKLDVDLSLQSVDESTEGDDSSYYDVDFMAVDVGGNKSSIETRKFKVMSPQCPDTDSYCPGDVRTADNCEGGQCPDGTKHVCLIDPATVCEDIPIMDTCGNPGCPAGTKDTNECAPISMKVTGQNMDGSGLSLTQTYTLTNTNPGVGDITVAVNISGGRPDSSCWVKKVDCDDLEDIDMEWDNTSPHFYIMPDFSVNKSYTVGATPIVITIRSAHVWFWWDQIHAFIDFTANPVSSEGAILKQATTDNGSTMGLNQIRFTGNNDTISCTESNCGDCSGNKVLAHGC